MDQKKNCFVFVFILLAFLVAVATPEEIRIWTHVNGTRIAGKLIEVKNGEALILYGESKTRVKLKDLSEADLGYLAKTTNKEKSGKDRFWTTNPDLGILQRYLNFGEEANLIDQQRIEQTTRQMLTSMIKKNPDRKIFWLQTYKWSKGTHGKNIFHVKLIYLKDSKELIFLGRKDLSFEAPDHYARWHEWARWKNIMPNQWDEEIPFEKNEFKSDYDPRTAKESFDFRFPEFPSLADWP